MARYPGFVGGSYTLANPIAAADELVNWFPSKVESGTGSAPYVLDPVPGHEEFCDTSNGPIRGLFTMNGGSFTISDDSLYELPTTVSGTPILRASGINNPDNSWVTIRSNGDAGRQLEFASGSQLYSFDLVTNTLTAVDLDARISTVAFQDGYFLLLDPNTSTFYLTALEDGSTVDPLDAAQRNDTADKWVAMLERAAPKEVWLFGSLSTSVYYDSGDADFPYIPNPSVAIARGIAAPRSADLLNGSPIWLADDLTVRYANGYNAQRVSDFGMEQQIGQYSTVADADAFTYTEAGHPFYVLNFPTANVSWTFDLLSGMWHKRGPANGLNFDVLPVWGHIYADGRHLVGSRTTGKIYQQSQSFATEIDGTTGMCRMRRAPHVGNELRLTAYDRFQLYMEVGLGLQTGQGSDPEVMLRFSDDGGQSFGNIVTAKAGKVGQFKQRVIWNRLGSARDRVFEVRVSDPIPWRLVDAFLDLRVGAS